MRAIRYAAAQNSEALVSVSRTLAWDDYRERVYPLFTRVSPFDDAEKERLSKELGYPVAAIIPNEYVRVSEAADNGRLVVDEDPDSPFAKAVDALAEKIISK